MYALMEFQRPGAYEKRGMGHEVYRENLLSGIFLKKGHSDLGLWDHLAFLLGI